LEVVYSKSNKAAGGGGDLDTGKSCTGQNRKIDQAAWKSKEVGGRWKKSKGNQNNDLPAPLWRAGVGGSSGSVGRRKKSRVGPDGTAKEGATEGAGVPTV